MHFEHEDRSLWYGTPDALAPEGAVQAGTEIAITVGVSPVDASNYVELLYRVNQGPTEMVAARWMQNDPSGKAQYFRARLPAFRAGDTVEYIPICSWAGRQVPSPDQARQFASSIRVTDAQAKSPQDLKPTASDSGDLHQATGCDARPIALTATPVKARAISMARRRDDGGEELPPDNPFPDPDPLPLPDPGEPSTRIEDMIEARDRWVDAMTFWQIANEESTAQRFANAEVYYEESQKAVVRYFEKFYTSSPLHLDFNIVLGQPPQRTSPLW